MNTLNDRPVCATRTLADPEAYGAEIVYARGGDDRN
jgi:hypothetical protein